MEIGSYALYGFLVSVIWVLTALFDYLHYTYLWQLKEYRLDRFRDYLYSEQGKELWRDYRFLWRGLSALVLFLWPLPYMALGVLLLDVFYIIFIRKGKVRRPVMTKKAILILFLSFALELFLFSFFKTNLPFVLFLRFFLVSFIIFFLFAPSQLAKKFFIYKATKKMASYPKLTVVGITGSYGKSSVKEFTAHILSSQFRVIKTPKNINSEIGIAQFILKTDFNDIDVFVCEMGAYKMGEIALICNIVKPKVGILTTIAEQHLVLFGSIENIQTAKYELLRAIPEDGLILTNADNPYCVEKLKELKCKTIETCGFEDANKPSYQIIRIKPTLRGTEFEAIYQGQRGKVFVPNIGAHQAYNASLAIMVAVNFGIDPKKIVQSTQTLPKDAHGSLKMYSYGKASIIDDSYNSNPEGFRSAIEVLSLFPSEKRRIVITRGMLELGDQSDLQHEKIGEEIAYYCDELIIITADFVEALKRGVGKKFLSNVKTIFDATELLEYLQTLKNENCAILFENRMPQMIMQEIKKKNSV